MNYYNPYVNFAPYITPTTQTGLLSRIFKSGKFSLSSILNGTQRTLNFINQAIPVVKQVSPMLQNAKTMFKVMNEFKKTENNTKINKKTESIISANISNNKNNEFILAVADGMGGHKAGEIASSIAIEHITSVFEKMETIGKKEDAIDWLRQIVKEINEKIFSYTSTHPERKGMGTTLVIAIKTDDYILYGNIGDSSGYAIKNEKMHKITKDHTLVNLLVSTGELTPEQAKFHPRKNLLTRALGANDPIEIDIFSVDNTVNKYDY